MERGWVNNGGVGAEQFSVWRGWWRGVVPSFVTAQKSIRQLGKKGSRWDGFRGRAPPGFGLGCGTGLDAVGFRRRWKEPYL